MLASIPSPSSGTLELGPLTVHMYGLMLLAGIAAAVLVAGRRWSARGGDWDLIFRLAVWGVAGGIVGARLYHIATSWSDVPDEWWGPLAIWKGGLGIWGGIAGGILVGAFIARREGVAVRELLDVVAPALLVAQAIGRVGNWWNQELFGRPTDLPWALEIDLEHRPIEFSGSETFHPTFLYEGLWCLLGAVVLLLVARRFRIIPPGLFALYVAWYCAGRISIEELRVDPAHELGPLRLNTWVAIAGLALALLFFLWWQFVRGRRAGDAAGPAAAGASRGRVRRRR
jgi:prolipoprotein diacylglyceryl transferase